jgi:hypothetical protein
VAPLAGDNLVRLLYLDEAGTEFRAAFLAVAGVLVHGDHQWPEVDRRIVALIKKYIPEPDRLGFVFHATDIFHGSHYFDRRKSEWDSTEKRWPILADLAQIIADLNLPVVVGTYRKETFGDEEIRNAPKGAQRDLIQGVSVLDCLIWAERWLERYAPAELIRHFVRVARDPALMRAWEFPEEAAKEFNLPLRRIIDTVHFAEKADARPLQLADLCAFILGRAMKGMEVPIGVFETIFRQLAWLLEIQGKEQEAINALAALSGEQEKSS